MVRYDGTVTVVRWYGGTVQWDGTVVRGDSTLVQYCGTVAISGCIIHSLIQPLNNILVLGYKHVPWYSR